jgi:hypothetical protein
MFYGNSASNYFRIQTNSADQVAVAGGLVGIGTNSPVSKLDVNGGVSVGSYAGVNASPTNGLIVSGVSGFGTNSPNSFVGLTVAAANASSTGTIVNSASSPTADVQQWQINGSSVAHVTSNGGVALYSRSIAQLVATTPAFVGETFYCNNCSAKAVVVATGTASGNFALASGANFQ